MHHFTIWSVLICIDLITVGEECHHSHIYITSNLPLHCLNPTYNALLFWQTSDILLYEEANELYQNHPMKLYPIPDKPYISTPHLTNTTLCVPYTTPHLTNTTLNVPYTYVPTPDVDSLWLHLMCADVPYTWHTLAVPYTWQTLHWLPYTWWTLRLWLL